MLETTMTMTVLIIVNAAFAAVICVVLAFVTVTFSRFTHLQPTAPNTATPLGAGATALPGAPRPTGGARAPRHTRAPEPVVVRT
jgi:hypothetical protein